MMDDAFPESDRIEGIQHPRETYQIFGQETAQNLFLDAFGSNRLHHAWLISGPKGVGKATLAWAMARFVLATNEERGNEGSLRVDPDTAIARRIASLGEPRLCLVRRPYDTDKKRLKTQITIDEIRKLKSFFQLSAADGGRRVAIIDAADDMNVSAANALLKILEEPPEKALLFLVAHQPSKLLPTIKSRCRSLACHKLDKHSFEQAMIANDTPLGADGHYLSELADGSVGQAMTLSQMEGAKIYHTIAQLGASLPKLDRAKTLKLAESCAGAAKESQYRMTLDLVRIYLSRLAKFGAVQPNDFQEAAPEEARTFARLSPNPHSARKWADLLAQLNSKTEYARAVNLDPAAVILDMFLEMNKTAQAS